MAFIDTWVTAYAKLATEAEQRELAPRALADLERSYATMTATHLAAAAAPRARPRRPARPDPAAPSAPAGRQGAARVLLPLCRAGLLDSPWPDLSTNIQQEEESLAFVILIGMLFTLISFSPAILCYALTRLADRPRRTPGPLAAPPGAPASPAWADHSYPGPVPSSPGQVGAGYPPAG